MTGSLHLIPSVVEPLRQTRVFGFLVERADHLYRFGSSEPVCSKALGDLLVQGGWLEKFGSRYELTEQGRHAAEE